MGFLSNLVARKWSKKFQVEGGADFPLNQKYINKSKNELSDAMNEGSPSAWLTKVTSHGLPMIPIEN